MKRFAGLLVLSLFVTGAVLAVPCGPTLPAAGVGARLPNGNALLYVRGENRALVHVASQNERDCMEMNRLYWVAKLAAYRDLIPNTYHRLISSSLGLGLPFTRIRVRTPYQGTLYAELGSPFTSGYSGADWVIGPQGRDYQMPGYILEAARAEMSGHLSGAGRDAGVRDRLLADPGLTDVLDIDTRTWDPRKHAAFRLPGDYFPYEGDTEPTPRPAWDSTRAGSVNIDTRAPLPSCGNGNCAGLQAILDAHMCGTPAHCGRTVSCPSVKDALYAYENGCGGDEKCEAFRRMKPFFVPEDTTNYTRDQLCYIGELQHVMMMRWADCERAGDWRCAELNDTRHQELHFIMGVGDPNALWLFDDDGRPSNYGNSFGGAQSIQSLLPKLVDKYGVTLP
jgi:hypothetical protein